MQVNNEDSRVRKWSHCSDENIRDAEEREVLSCEAYLLFYDRIAKAQELPPNPP